MDQNLTMAATTEDLRALERLLAGLSPDLYAKLQKEVEAHAGPAVWTQNPGPQTRAMECDADELFYGGEAGGGKSDLLVGLSLTKHRKSLVLRRTNVEANKLVDRFAEVLQTRVGWNSQDDVWRLADGRVMDIRGCQHEDDKQKFKGAPHDLIGFDEIADFSETQYRFIIGWNRSTDKAQRCRVVATGNPPTSPEGLWVLKYWGAWVDPTHPKPAKEGELRWYTTIAGVDREVDGPGPHLIKGDMITARSRTFIRARLSDNPDLEESGYRSVLAAMPEELRAAYMEGRFDAGLKDSAYQVIPTAWVIAAQERWKPDGHDGLTMTAVGLDPAGGGRDSAEIAVRYGGWYGHLHSEKGEQTGDGSLTCAAVVKFRRDGAPIVVDAGGGYGGAVILRFKDNEIDYLAFNGANTSLARTKDGTLRFANKRAEVWWKFREELNPDQEGGSAICLPPDPELKADLCTPTYTMSAKGILLESKDEIRKRLGRSPGKGDAVTLALSEGNRAATRKLRAMSFVGSGGGNRLPQVVRGFASAKR